MYLSVLGTEYEIIRKDYADEPAFEKREIIGYCDTIIKQIVICNAKTLPNCKEKTEEYCVMFEKSTLRHEIVHAFLFESGLNSSSGRIINQGWAENEELVDWIALQAPKLIAAFKAADAL